MFKPDYFASVLQEAIPVRLAARSFIIPVPAGVGRPMVYPHDIYGMDGNTVFKAGDPILDKAKNQKHGIVFINHTDGAVQGARDDGKSMIIVNGITSEQGEKLLARYQQVMPTPEHATESSIHEMLRYAHQDLGIEDFFNGDSAKIPSFDVEKRHPQNSECGVFIRRSDEERFALIGVGSGTFEGPASSPQRFDGGVVVLANAKHTWMVQTSAFLNTYRHPDNREFKLSELPAFAMNQNKSPVQAARLTS